MLIPQEATCLMDETSGEVSSANVTETSLGCESWINVGLQGIHSLSFPLNGGMEKGDVIFSQRGWGDEGTGNTRYRTDER